MIGKIGITPTFKGYIIVPCIRHNSHDGIKVRHLNTYNISSIEKFDNGHTGIETSNYGLLYVPQKLAPTHNIVTAYAAAKNDLVTVDARV